MLNPIISHFSAIIALVTLSCVMIHDANIDKAFGAHLSGTFLQSQATDADNPSKVIRPETHVHNHGERTSLNRLVQEMNGHPRVQPREEKRHLSQRRIAKGFWAFDCYRLLLARAAR